MQASESVKPKVRYDIRCAPGLVNASHDPGRSELIGSNPRRTGWVDDEDVNEEDVCGGWSVEESAVSLRQACER